MRFVVIDYDGDQHGGRGNDIEKSAKKVLKPAARALHFHSAVAAQKSSRLKRLLPSAATSTAKAAICIRRAAVMATFLCSEEEFTAMHSFILTSLSI
jgi:hypothetical protein